MNTLLGNHQRHIQNRELKIMFTNFVILVALMCEIRYVNIIKMFRFLKKLLLATKSGYFTTMRESRYRNYQNEPSMTVPHFGFHPKKFCVYSEIRRVFSTIGFQGTKIFIGIPAVNKNFIWLFNRKYVILSFEKKKGGLSRVFFTTFGTFSLLQLHRKVLIYSPYQADIVLSDQHLF